MCLYTEPNVSLLKSMSMDLSTLLSMRREAMRQPIIRARLNASPLGLFLLKGVPGEHVLAQIMPEEIWTGPQQGNQPKKRLTLSRGKTTCIAPSDTSTQPWKPEIPLVDIFELPLLPKRPGLRAVEISVQSCPSLPSVK